MEKNKKKCVMRYFLHDIVWGIASLFGYLWFRPKRCYINDSARKKIKGGALLISNHVGYYDPVYIMISLNYRRHHFVATKELFSTKFKRFLFEKVFLCISIDRENVGTGTIKKIVELLKDNEVVTMFPEGHINVENNNIEAFKSGAVLMALKSGRPIIPIYIHKRKNVFKRLVMVVGEPLYISLANTQLSAMDYINEMTKRLYKKEKELENYYNNIINRR